MYIDFDYLKPQLRSLNLISSLEQLYPEGVRKHKEFFPWGDRCSLSINIQNGCWSRFSGKSNGTKRTSGKGLWGLHCYIKGSAREAAIDFCQQFDLKPAQPKSIRGRI